MQTWIVALSNHIDIQIHVANWFSFGFFCFFFFLSGLRKSSALQGRNTKQKSILILYGNSTTIQDYLIETKENSSDENKKKESELKSEEVVSSDESEKGEIKNDQTSEDQKPIGEEIIDNEISKKKE